MLVEQGAVRIVQDETQLAAVIGGLLADPTTRTVMGASGRKVVDSNRGAVARLMEFLEPLLP
jgi:3-deoxy-D-manno-octulosonic-acid transferase